VSKISGPPPYEADCLKEIQCKNQKLRGAQCCLVEFIAKQAYFCGIPSDFATFSCAFEEKSVFLPQNLRYYCE